MNDIPIKDLSKDPFEQMKLVYDYIKFHTGLYLATPPVFVIIAESFEVKTRILFQVGLVLMIIIYGISGAHAGFFMGRFINTKWDEKTLSNFGANAYSNTRRNMHHPCIGLGLRLA
jgi:hypothetical protein